MIISPCITHPPDGLQSEDGDYWDSYEQLVRYHVALKDTYSLSFGNPRTVSEEGGERSLLDVHMREWRGHRDYSIWLHVHVRLAEDFGDESEEMVSSLL